MNHASKLWLVSEVYSRHIVLRQNVQFLITYHHDQSPLNSSINKQQTSSNFHNFHNEFLCIWHSIEGAQEGYPDVRVFLTHHLSNQHYNTMLTEEQSQPSTLVLRFRITTLDHSFVAVHMELFHSTTFSTSISNRFKKVVATNQHSGFLRN